MKWFVIWPKDPLIQEDRLRKVWEYVLSHTDALPRDTLTYLHSAQELEACLSSEEALTGSRVIFAAALGPSGINLTLCAMLRLLRLAPGCLEHSAAGMIIDGGTELYTKSTASELALTLSGAGCTLIGRSLVEGTGSSYNFSITARNRSCSLTDAYYACAAELAARLADFTFPKADPPRILCIHSSNRATSNTLRLWELVKKGFDPGAGVREISLRNGDVRDCAGCSFETCMYYSRTLSCYYGGSIVEEVYPALEWCSHLVLLCPNYNDAVGANLTAFINRLTSIFRKRPFYDKLLYALIVSGYSGSDLVAKQLIDSLSMNKAFVLPGHFALSATANLPGSLDRIPDIAGCAKKFGESLYSRREL